MDLKWWPTTATERLRMQRPPHLIIVPVSTTRLAHQAEAASLLLPVLMVALVTPTSVAVL